MKEIVNKVAKIGKEVVKLRLRGKGSGFKEGPRNKESEEELHLCLSANGEEEYNRAVELVEELLNKVYAEYHTYTKEMLDSPVKLKVKKTETFQPRKWSTFSN